MDKVALLGVVILMAGCTSLAEDFYMPSEAYEARRNPHLLQCGTGSVPVCEALGGRARKSFDRCKCLE